MNKNKIAGLLLLAAAAWWYFTKKKAASAETPRNAFGAPLDSQKPAIFGFNTARLNPQKTRQATNGTANGGQSGAGGNLDLVAIVKALKDLITSRKGDPSPVILNTNGRAIPVGDDDPTYQRFLALQGQIDDTDFEAPIRDFGLGDIFAPDPGDIDEGPSYEAEVLGDLGFTE